ncbi:hypothetical protein ACSU1N_05475 [Thermogladius sp. 4427co]|uniref:hypothetical protein n=1 Tax=Thermogladius sp. 4427co TaxID=3450718 RepID=UPI003F7952B2
MKQFRIVIVGFGNVGRSLVKTILLKDSIIEKYGINLSIVGLVDSKGMVYKPDGFKSFELLKLLDTPRSSLGSVEGGRPYVDLKELYYNTAPNIHVELTPANYDTGEPGLSNIKLALSNHSHVVTANKSPLVIDFRGITELARSKGLRIKYSATVLGASSFIALLEHMRLQNIVRVRGILNTTSNIILSAMHEKLVELDQAIAEATAAGTVEKDVSVDIDGLDAAAKLTIISNIVGKPIDFKRIEKTSLRSLNLRDIASALKERMKWKQISYMDLEKGEARVGLEKVDARSLFYNIDGAMNAVLVETDVGNYFFAGKGGGGVETAHTVANDILSICTEVFE